MADTCKVGASFGGQTMRTDIGKEEADQCAAQLQEVSGKLHWVSQSTFSSGLPGGTRVTYTVQKFSPDECKDGAEFTVDGKLNVNQLKAEECAVALNRLRDGNSYVAQLLKKAGWLSADHYTVVKK